VHSKKIRALGQKVVVRVHIFGNVPHPWALPLMWDGMDEKMDGKVFFLVFKTSNCGQ
jgi:hypothetical protein